MASSSARRQHGCRKSGAFTNHPSLGSRGLPEARYIKAQYHTDDTVAASVDEVDEEFEEEDVFAGRVWCAQRSRSSLLQLPIGLNVLAG